MAGTKDAVKPKFKVKWTKKDKSTYSISAKDYEALYKFFEAKNKKKEEWGKFSVTTPQISFKPPKGNPITEVLLKIGHTTTMPKWAKYSKASKGAKKAWDAMYKALETHEERHRLILLEEVAKFAAKIETSENLDTKGLKKLLTAFSPDVEKAQKKYDDATGHGQKEGVFLPAPDKVDK